MEGAVGQSARDIAVGGWVALNLEISLILFEELSLNALPVVAAAKLPAARGIRSQEFVDVLALTASRAAAMPAFWAPIPTS